MKLSLVIALFCLSFVYANPSVEKLRTDKEKPKKEEKKLKGGTVLGSKNFHSIKKWKITIAFTNGEVISKIMEITKKSSLSPMDIAFTEAEKCVKRLKGVEEYKVTPIGNNNYVLLANKS
ncbi:hypothetical protein AB832_05995 [Flavobacteriaceae bacterium (ex Bugula neritina AB1)]|nr:hypothetical protein AB832_05995 [Flavobacteriaceae bacterium (ex Bugula neritina AB1)]